MPVTPAIARRPSTRTLRGLDWLNFFLADAQSGVGPFLSVYLASEKWSPQRIGIALTVGGIAGVVTQAPLGALVDRAQRKRALFGGGLAVLATASLVIAFWPRFWPVALAEVAIGATSSVFMPVICALSMGAVGRRAFDERQGRNQAFNSAGNVLAALLMGGIGYFLGIRDEFFYVVALTVPTALALAAIRPRDVDYTVARGASRRGGKTQTSSALVLLRDRRLLVFLACAVLYHFANAAMLPLVGEMLARAQGRSSTLYMAGCVLTTQVVVAALASWIGRRATHWGRKPLLLVGFGVLPVRAVLYTFAHVAWALVAIQVLDGVGAAVFGVVSVLVVADVTNGTGRFNLAVGAVSTAVGIGASLSQLAAGAIAEHLGFAGGFWFLAAIATVAVAVLALAMPETRDARIPAIAKFRSP